MSFDLIHLLGLVASIASLAFGAALCLKAAASGQADLASPPTRFFTFD